MLNYDQKITEIKLNIWHKKSNKGQANFCYDRENLKNRRDYILG